MTRTPKQVQRGERSASGLFPEQPCLCRDVSWCTSFAWRNPGYPSFPVNLHSMGAYFSWYSKHNLSSDSLDSFVNLSIVNLCISFVLCFNTLTKALSEINILHSCILFVLEKVRVLLGLKSWGGESRWCVWYKIQVSYNIFCFLLSLIKLCQTDYQCTLECKAHVSLFPSILFLCTVNLLNAGSFFCQFANIFHNVLWQKLITWGEKRCSWEEQEMAA